jgi:anti-anti-sigma factor
MSSQTILLSPNAHQEIDQLRSEIDQLLQTDVSVLVVDMRQVTLLDSMLIGQLVKICLNLKARGATMQLHNLHPRARTVIRHSNLDHLFGLTIELPRWEP